MKCTSETQPKRVLLSRKLRLLANFFILILSVLTILSIIEVVFRFYENAYYKRRIRLWNNPLYRIIPDSLIEYQMIPNTHRTQKVLNAPVVIEWSYTINRNGFRGKDITPRKEPNVKRVLFLGDSYTFGWAVNDDEIFSEQIVQFLNQKNNFKIEAVNLGVPGYNTIQEYAVLIDNVQRYVPDMVVLAYVLNDAEPQWTVPAHPKNTYKYAKSWLLEFLKFRINTKFFPDKPFFKVMLQKHNTNYLEGFLPTSFKWKDSKDALLKIAQFCRQSHLPLLVTVLPDFNQKFDASYCCQLIHNKVQEWSNELHVDFIDLLPYFQGTDHQEFQVVGDGHPNAKGHRKMAEVLANPIERILTPQSEN